MAAPRAPPAAWPLLDGCATATARGLPTTRMAAPRAPPAACPLLDKAVADADRHCLGAGRCLEFRQDALRVSTDGLGREAELLGHGVGLHPVGEHLEDLALARAERPVALVEHD